MRGIARLLFFSIVQKYIVKKISMWYYDTVLYLA